MFCGVQTRAILVPHTLFAHLPHELAGLIIYGNVSLASAFGVSTKALQHHLTSILSNTARLQMMCIHPMSHHRCGVRLRPLASEMQPECGLFGAITE